LEDCYQQTAVWFGWRLTGAGLDLLVTGSAAWSQGARWLPGQLLGALATGGTADVTYARAAALLAVYLAIALAAAATLLARRDVTS
jgi:hypothetical protein